MYTSSGDASMNESVDLPGRTVSHAKNFGCGKHYIQSSFEQLEYMKFLLHRSSDHTDIQSLWGQCRHYAQIIKSERSIKYYTQSGPPNITNNLLPKSTCDRLITLYLHTFESVFRVLHIPTFMQQYELYWNNPLGTSRAFPSTLALVLAIGACFVSDADADELQLLASKWIYGAQFWLTDSFEKFDIDLSILQVSALLLLARQTLPDPSELVWISGDFPLRIAVGLGLHKEARIHFPDFPPVETELRKRLWATILEMSIQSCLDTGMPPSISNDDFDCEPPSNIHDVDVSNPSAAADTANSFTQSTILRMLMQTMPVRLQILRYCNALKKTPSQDYQGILKLGMQLDTMCRSHTAMLQSYQMGTNSDTPKPTEFQIHVLNILARRFLLALHSPFAVEAKADQSFYFSRKVLTENALLCLSPPQTVQHAPLPLGSLPECQHELLRLKVRGGDIIKHTLCHATAILIIELITELEENAFPITHSLSQDLFCHTIEESMGVFRRRIQAGETSVDIYVLFSCAMAQAKVIKAGLAPERQIIETAKESLVFCCEQLKFKAQTSALSFLGLAPSLQLALENDPGGLNSWESMEIRFLPSIRPPTHPEHALDNRNDLCH
ncbi:hypothetical protein EYZ11_003103 [Aspergillus tanneri]|uniref:Xylanolytic transcriptional activator regulatory domain-containing protein n=1 Tax=Aspergillus tanneri TaxID=1220188 RepID=A0A4V3UQ31_9EURO|nr:hypothetical protein EYZ11_003103 [Aspergillus tanneri]